MKSNVKTYYQDKPVSFRMSGDRSTKILPLLDKLRNRVVLDAGCASGYVGSFVKKRGNYVVGIDSTRRDIVLAKKVLDEAYVFDLESENKVEFSKRFDFIIFSEVIEHLFEPEKALKRLISWLKPDGQILVTTPNFVHLYNRISILLGKFVYREDTVINRSHVHFFTYKTLKDLIADLNLEVIAENHLFFPRTLNFFWRFFPKLFAHQIIFICRKK